MDSEGLSRGIITGWNSNAMLSNVFSIKSGLFTEVFCKILGFSLSIINVYGSYEGRHNFWDRILTS
jgi:hypothetical protein